MTRNILIVDDSSTTRGMVRRIIGLSHPNPTGGPPAINMVEAPDGKQALELLRASSFDLVLSDLHMPVMSGTELIRQIRADPRLASLPVVVISANPNASLDEELRPLNIAGYLGKPFTPERFRDVLMPLIGELNHA
jgi:two-component system, chemotaxis family, chemotaxis protein CheY